MPDRSRKHPSDHNQLAKFVVDRATGIVDAVAAPDGKNPAAVALGRLGGIKGGVARAKKLSPEQRKKIAIKAAKSRWGARRDKEDGE